MTRDMVFTNKVIISPCTSHSSSFKGSLCDADLLHFDAGTAGRCLDLAVLIIPVAAVGAVTWEEGAVC